MLWLYVFVPPPWHPFWSRAPIISARVVRPFQSKPFENMDAFFAIWNAIVGGLICGISPRLDGNPSGSSLCQPPRRPHRLCPSVDSKAVHQESDFKIVIILRETPPFPRDFAGGKAEAELKEVPLGEVNLVLSPRSNDS